MKRRITSNRGMALLTALIVMVMLTAVVAILYRVGRLDLDKTINSREIANARLASESGLNYVKYHIRECAMANCDTGDDAISGLKQYFTSVGISYSGTTTEITIPETSIAGMDGTFSATITSLGSSAPADDTDPVLNLMVTGDCDGTQRAVKLDFRLAMGSRSPLFDFGFSSGGVLKMNGSSVLVGRNDPEEANIYMSNLINDEVVVLIGTASIDGKVFACNDDAYVDAGANCSVAGDFGADIADNVYQGIDEYPLPQIDTSPFINAVSSFTTIGPTTDTTDGTFSNIKISAGTNPKFTGTTNISGLIYIEAPNKVEFSGTVNITGVIVTETGNGGSDCSIDFKGGLHMEGPENLPDLPEYAALKALPGTSILAEGFTVSFSGVNDCVGGTMAADTFYFNGNGDLDVYGTIICYGDTELTTLTGNQTVIIDLSGGPETPPGFVGGGLTVLVPLADTYASTPEGHF